MSTKLDRLLEKESQLKAQIQLAKASERTLEKKRDTRRKILVGAAVMTRVDRGDWPKADLLSMMDGFLTRPNERELFGLDGAEESAAANAVDNEPKTTATDKKSSGQHSAMQKAKKKEKPRAQTGKDAVAVDTGTSGTLPVSDLDIEKEFRL